MKIRPRILQVLVVIFVFFVCVSCVPIPIHHYYPEASGGEVIYSSCPFNEHLPYEIRFSPQGVRVFTRLGKHERKRFIEVRFEVPEGKIVKLIDTNVQAFWNGNKQSTKGEFRKISLVDTPIINLTSPVARTQEQILDINEPMVGKSMKTEDGGFAWDKNYWLASYLDVPAADEIRIILPQFMVNEELITLPQLHFRKKWVMGMAVINC